MCDSNTHWNSSFICNNYPCINDVCFCDGDYVHDLTFYRQRDCLMHRRVMPVFISLAFIGYVFNLIYALKSYNNSIGIGRLLIQMSCAWIIVSLFTLMSLYLNAFYMTGFGLLLYATSIQCALLCSYIIIYSIASPLYKLAETPETNMRKILTTLYLLFALLMYASISPAILIYQDLSNPANDYYWNLLITIFSFFDLAQTWIICIPVYFGGMQMVGIVNKLIESTPESPNKEKTKKYVAKALNIIRVAPSFGPISSANIAIPPIMFLVTQIAPYGYVIIGFTLFSKASVMQWFISYASREMAKDNIEKNGEAIANKLSVDSNETENVSKFDKRKSQEPGDSSDP